MKKVLGVIASILFAGTFFLLPDAYVPLAFLVVPVVLSLLPSNKKRALTYQRILPTSKIRSLAMGLAEVEGRLVATNLLQTPIGKKECIGYRYLTERIGRDKDGKDTYTTLHDETFCRPFFVADDTGKVLVDPTNLEFIWLPADERYRSGDKRYSQFVLFPNDTMLLVGGARAGANNIPEMAQEPVKKVFAIAPSNRVVQYNSLRPLRSSAVGFLCLFGLWVALVLLLEVRLEGNRLQVNWPKSVPAKRETAPGVFN